MKKKKDNQSKKVISQEEYKKVSDLRKKSFKSTERKKHSFRDCC